MRVADGLLVGVAGEVRAVFPPGAWVFPIARAEVLALDDAVRAAFAEHSTGEPLRLTALWQYVGARLPAFERGLLQERTARGAALAEALPDEIPAVTHTALTHALTVLDRLAALGAVLDGVRAHLRAVAEPGWRPVIDPEALIPDPAAIAATVDSPPRVVDADITLLVLLAAACAVGPAARSVQAAVPPSEWRDLGGEPAEIVAADDVVVRVAVDDVERLAFALTPAGDAYLAVTV